MIKNKILYLVIIVFLFSCSKSKNNRSNKNFDIYKFMLNYKFPKKISDSLLINNIQEDLNFKDAMSADVPRYIVDEYGNLFNNNNRYLIIKDQGIGDSYIWFLKTEKGFIKFYERYITDGLYIKDSIFDTNKDIMNELVIYKHRGGSGPDYKKIYYLSNDGLIKSEVNVEIFD